MGGLFVIEMGVTRGSKSDILKDMLNREDHGCSMFQVVEVNHFQDQMMNKGGQIRHFGSLSYLDISKEKHGHLA